MLKPWSNKGLKLSIRWYPTLCFDRCCLHRDYTVSAAVHWTHALMQPVDGSRAALIIEDQRRHHNYLNLQPVWFVTNGHLWHMFSWMRNKSSIFVQNCSMIMTFYYRNTAQNDITDTQAWMLNVFIQTEPRRMWGHYMISLVHLQEAGHQERTWPPQPHCCFRVGQLSYWLEYGQGLAAGDRRDQKFMDIF